MSPEQVEGLVVDHRSDVFSLGSVLYEMVAGVAPFQGKDIGALLMDILRAEPPTPGQFNAAIPPALDRVILKALRKSRDERYQDAQELAQDLETCIQALAPGAELDSTTFGGSASLTATRAVASSEATTVARPSPGLRVATGFDASKALQRIAGQASGTQVPMPRPMRPNWSWRAAFAAAILAAVWIAFG
jgi:eukaryotic-like serine/threonine-protein kinase